MAATKSKCPDSLSAALRGVLAAAVSPGEPLWVALSGGRDSVVLLHLLAQAGWDGPLGAIHVHHGLSPRADAWEAFCQALCTRLGIPLHVRAVQVARHSGLGLEAAARAARYQAFAEFGPGCLLLGHHAGDQAETVLFNLLRGAGVAGAAGMPLERRLDSLRLLRPLLGVARREIAAYARSHDLTWVEDESNADQGFSRNFLRHEVLPLLISRFPAAEATLAAAAGRFGEADALLAELAEQDWQSCRSGGYLRLTALRSLSRVRVKNLLRYRLRALGWQVPVATRLEEFVRQLFEAGPGARPQLVLPDGAMRVCRGRLEWRRASPRTGEKP